MYSFDVPRVRKPAVLGADRRSYGAVDKPVVLRAHAAGERGVLVAVPAALFAHLGKLGLRCNVARNVKERLKLVAHD